MKINRTRRGLEAIAGLAIAAPAALAQLPVPFTETFSSGAAGYDAIPNGVSIVEGANPFIRVSTPLTGIPFDANTIVSANIPLDPPGPAPSGGAFTGNYLAAGITSFSFDVRHDGPAPLTFSLRLATASNFPGVVVISPVPVFAGPDFTTITFSLDPSNPLLIPEGPPSVVSAILSNVGNFQLLVNVPPSLVGPTVTFDIDNVSILPAPSALAGLGALGLAAARRRRA